MSRAHRPVVPASNGTPPARPENTKIPPTFDRRCAGGPVSDDCEPDAQLYSRRPANPRYRFAHSDADRSGVVVVRRRCGSSDGGHRPGERVGPSGTGSASLCALDRLGGRPQASLNWLRHPRRVLTGLGCATPTMSMIVPPQCPRIIDSSRFGPFPTNNMGAGESHRAERQCSTNIRLTRRNSAGGGRVPVAVAPHFRSEKLPRNA